MMEPGFGIDEVLVLIPGDFTVRFVNDASHSRQRRILPLRDKDHFIAGQSGQMAGKVQVLAGQVLVSEEDFHWMKRYINNIK